MDARITNIHSAQWTEHVRKPGQQPWFELNVSGAHVGVRLEHIPPESIPAFTTSIRSRRSTYLFSKARARCAGMTENTC